MSKGLVNTIYGRSENRLAVVLGKGYHSGFYSGTRFTVARSRKEYACDICGKIIVRNSLYVVITPDRFAAKFLGERYRKRICLNHLRWKLVIRDQKGRIIYVY